MMRWLNLIIVFVILAGCTDGSPTTLAESDSAAPAVSTPSAPADDTDSESDDATTPAPSNPKPTTSPPEEAEGPTTASVGPIPGVGPNSLFGVYYGEWDNAVVSEITGASGAPPYRLLIVHPQTNLTPQMVAQLRSAGIKVFCYLTIGEDDTLHTSAASGGVTGPGGYASWYYDADSDGQPDRNANWDSYLTNPADPYWRAALRSYRNVGNEHWYGYGYLLGELGCDGLFLDTVDTVYPAAWGGPYATQLTTMIELIEEIRANMPTERYLIMNRGLFYFDPYDPIASPFGLTEITTAMRDRVRVAVNGVLYENFMDDPADERDYWGSRLDTEGDKPDGFTIFSLDYVANPTTTSAATTQSICQATKNMYGWLPYVSTLALDQFIHLVRDDCTY